MNPQQCACSFGLLLFITVFNAHFELVWSCSGLDSEGALIATIRLIPSNDVISNISLWE